MILKIEIAENADGKDFFWDMLSEINASESAREDGSQTEQLARLLELNKRIKKTVEDFYAEKQIVNINNYPGMDSSGNIIPNLASQ